MLIPYNDRISNDYNCFHTIVTITGYKALQSACIENT